jgi:hypothetical protein
MTFFLKKEMLRTTITKPSRVVVFGLVAAAAVLSGGYVLFLAVLAPEQLAEATVTASDVVCSGCVGNSDIAPNAVGSGKIADGSVKAADIGTDEVKAAEIGAGQVGNSEIASNAVDTAKILDGQVNTADIANGAFGVRSEDIQDKTIKSTDISTGTINLNLLGKEGNDISIAPGSTGTTSVTCPAGTLLTGGGYQADGVTNKNAQVYINRPSSVAGDPSKVDTWSISAFNEGNTNFNIKAIAVCIDTTIP